MMPKRIHRLTLIAAAIGLLYGCGTYKVEKVKEVTPHDRIEQAATRHLDTTGRPMATHGAAEAVVFESGVFVGRNPVKLRERKVLPPILNEQVWMNVYVRDLKELAERLSLRTETPVVVTQDALEFIRENAQQAPGSSAQRVSLLPPVPGATSAPTLDSSGTRVSRRDAGGPGDMGMQINYGGGTLRGLLDMVAARYGVSWEYEDGQIRFFRYSTQTFFVRAIPGSSMVDAKVASNTTRSGSGQQEGNTTQATSMRSDLSVWQGLDEAIRAMVSETGKYNVSAATSSITVTDTPVVLERVAQFIEKQNDSLGRQVLLNVQVLTVTRSAGDDYSISWELVFNALSTTFGMTNVVSATTGAVAMSAAILSSSSRFNGSKAVIQALSQQGDVSIKTTASVVALNNQPAPIQVGKQVTYVAESSTQITETGTTTSLTPGVVNSGFSMSVLPSIMHDNTLLLQMAADLSQLRNVRQITSGEVTIEAPEVDSKNFLQRVRMKSGETLILAGFEQDENFDEQSGLGRPDFSFLGGGKERKRSRETTVVLISPVVMN